MRRIISVTANTLIILWVAFVAGCAAAPERTDANNNTDANANAKAMPAAGSADQKQTSYTSQSWKTLIDESCQAYFDGCNQCRRALGAKAVACTRKACQSYQKPYCLDDKANSANAETEAATKHWANYRCQDGRALRVYFGEYRTAALTLTLPANKIMLEDNQLPAPITLEQGISASGSRYQGDNADFWSKGSSAHYAPPGQAAMPCEQTASGSFGER